MIPRRTSLCPARPRTLFLSRALLLYRPRRSGLLRSRGAAGTCALTAAGRGRGVGKSVSMFSRRTPVGRDARRFPHDFSPKRQYETIITIMKIKTYRGLGLYNTSLYTYIRIFYVFNARDYRRAGVITRRVLLLLYTYCPKRAIVQP